MKEAKALEIGHGLGRIDVGAEICSHFGGVQKGDEEQGQGKGSRDGNIPLNISKKLKKNVE